MYAIHVSSSQKAIARVAALKIKQTLVFVSCSQLNSLISTLSEFVARIVASPLSVAFIWLIIALRPNSGKFAIKFLLLFRKYYNYCYLFISANWLMTKASAWATDKQLVKKAL